MKKKKRTASTARQTLILVIVVLLLIVTALACTFVWLYRPHDSGVLPFSTETTPNTDVPHVLPENPEEGRNNPALQYIPRDEVYNFLLIGHDRAATLADVVMLINYDVKAGKVSIMQLPRDTYFEGDANVPSLNVQFSAYFNRAIAENKKSPAAAAADQFARALERNLCIKIHYTAVMNLDGFVNIVDAIDGVDIDIPADMDYDDPEQDLSIHLKAGMNHLTGAKAEGFVRFREGYTQADIGRVNAQKLFVTAFVQKVKSTVTLSNTALLSKLANEVVNNLTTDISGADALYFAKNVLSVDLSSITMMTVPCDYAGGLVINRAATLAAINDYFNIYQNDIADSIFDPNRAFVNESNEKMLAAYLSDTPVIQSEYTAQEIGQGSIHIPRTGN